jgi:hypothetical protein
MEGVMVMMLGGVFAADGKIYLCSVFCPASRRLFSWKTEISGILGALKGSYSTIIVSRFFAFFMTSS